MTDEPKLCKDCKWYRKSWVEHLIFSNDGDDKCVHPVLSRNLVSGKVKGGRACSFMRLHGGGCSPEGRYWEAK